MVHARKEMAMNADQAKKDDRDNNFVVRWAVAAVIVVAIGAVGYNYLARTGSPDMAPTSTPVQVAPSSSPPATPSK